MRDVVSSQETEIRAEVSDSNPDLLSQNPGTLTPKP